MVERMASTSLYERAEHAARIIRARTTVEPRIAVVLGSGLGGFADDLKSGRDSLRRDTGFRALRLRRVTPDDW